MGSERKDERGRKEGQNGRTKGRKDGDFQGSERKDERGRNGTERTDERTVTFMGSERRDERGRKEERNGTERTDERTKGR